MTCQFSERLPVTDDDHVYGVANEKRTQIVTCERGSINVAAAERWDETGFQAGRVNWLPSKRMAQIGDQVAELTIR